MHQLLRLTPLLVGALTLQPSCAEPELAPESGDEGGRRPAIGVAIRGRVPRASGGFPSVILFDSRNEAQLPAPPTDERPLMDQYGMEFHPSILLARTGQTLEFQNSEDELHNVRVVNTETQTTLFNVATPVIGSYSFVFDQAAAYDVSCDTHPAMAAFIIVTETPYVVIADKDGAFVYDGLREGVYDVRVWNVTAGRRRETVIDVGDDDVELDLTENGVNHSNSPRP